MTIGAWIFFIIVACGIIGFAIYLCIDALETVPSRILAIVISIAIIAALYLGLTWVFHNTESGKRALIDQRSDFNGGIERTINVYTANGDILASYTGKIDIADADGGYVKFDYDGKRYIYYNCFVETIAELEER